MKTSVQGINMRNKRPCVGLCTGGCGRFIRILYIYTYTYTLYIDAQFLNMYYILHTRMWELYCYVYVCGVYLVMRIQV